MKLSKFLTLFGAAALAACDIGGIQMAGIDAGGERAPTVVSHGTITGFGSVIVNGVRFDTSNATFTIDGQLGTQNDLSAGDVVLVQGTIDSSHDSGSAESVSFDDIVEGPIDSIDLGNNSLVVMGQTVLVNDGTSFDDDIAGRSLMGLNDGEVVEVSGFVNASEEIVATRIERKQSGGEFEVTGVVQNLNSADLRFNINALIVDYSTAMINDFATGAPSDGDRVEVEGMSFVAGVLVATEVEFKGPEIDLDDVDRVEIEGLITRFVSATDFDVAGQPTTTNAQTEFEHGTAADLALNLEVEVEGRLVDGILVADEVEFHRPHNIRIEATVDSVDVAGNTLTLLGITVVVNAVTRFEDHSSADLETFGLGDINGGDFLEVRGFEEPAGSDIVVATRVERDDLEPDVELRGFVESFSEPNLVILGVTIQTDSATTEFEDVNGDPITATVFFDTVAMGDLVEAEGAFDGNDIIANEVEFED